MTTFGPQRKAVPELEEVLQSTPLFMQSLGEDAMDSDTMNALQSLIYDGTPEEMALNFKEQGNEAFQAGKAQFKSAIEFYSKGLAAKCSDSELNSVLYCNRAAVNLELSNFGKVLKDCGEAIKLNPKNVKAFYRSTKALLALDRIVEARDSCKMGLQLEPENKALLDIQTKIETRHAAIEKARLAARERERLKKEKEDALWGTIKARGVTCVSALKKAKSDSPEDVSRLTQEAFLSSHTPVLDDATKTLSYPVTFLYPEHAQSDFIQSFHENDAFADHFDVMFGGPEGSVPWDTARAYIPQHLEVYFETRPDLDAAARGEYYKEWRDGKRKLMRVDPASTLGDVVGSAEYRLVDGVASFFVLSAANKSFCKQFRKSYKE